MKKILLLIVFTITLVSLTSCKYNVSRNKSVTLKEAMEFLNTKENPFEDGSVSFELNYKSYEESISKSYNYQNGFDLKTYGTIDEDFIGSIKYEMKGKLSTTNALLSGKEKTSTTKVEEGICFFREDSDDNKYYFTIDINTKIPDGKIKRNLLKTTLKSDSTYIPEVVSIIKNNIISLNTVNTSNKYQENDFNNRINISIPDGCFCYVSNDKMKIVQSSSNKHSEKVYVFKDDEISSIKYVYKYQSDNGIIYTETEIIFKDTKDIKVPRDAEKYKTEYQQYNPGLFDNINFGLILLILFIHIIAGAIVLVVIRIVKRPKYQE